MATKTIEFSIDGTLNPSSAKLVRAEAGIAIADPAGHALTTLGAWRFSFTVIENLIGVYRIDILDDGGTQIGVQWVYIVADLVVTYTASNDFQTAMLHRTVVDEVTAAVDLLEDITTNLSRIPKAATETTAGGPIERHLENANGDTLQTIYEVIDGDA